MRRRSSVFGSPGWVAVALALLTTLASVAGLASASGSLGLVGPVPRSPADNPVPAAATLPFSERAGYLSWEPAAATDTHPESGSVTVVLTFQPSTPAFYDPLPSGARPLSLSQVAAAYGLSGSDYSSAEQYFIAEGLSIAHTWPDRLSLTVEGPAAAVGRAFGTTLEQGTWSGRSVTFPATPPSLPAPLDRWTLAVNGLESGFDSFSLPLSSETSFGSAGVNATRPASSGSLVGPSVIHQIYGLSDLYNLSGTSHWSTGEAIVLLLWGWGYDPSDLSTFYADDYPSDLPAPTIQAFPVDGAPAPAGDATHDPSGAPFELTLDLEWSGSEAPGATLDAVYAPDGPAADDYSPTDASMVDALNEALSLPHVVAISMSFGSQDTSTSPLQVAWENDFAAADQSGITLVAASGDDGGNANPPPGCSGGPQPLFPAASPYVLAVGGTAPTLSYDVLGGVTGIASEPAWNRSGGGFSTTYSAPSWERVGSAAAPIAANGGYRAMPDVAAPAAYDYIYYAGASGAGSGTSFASPLWAGLIASMDAVRGAPFGFLTPRLYATAAAEATGAEGIGLVDVQGGTTCLGTAGPGWDEESGWGTPRAVPLYENLAGTYVNLTISVSPSVVAPGGSVAVSVLVKNATTGAGIPNLPVSIQVASPSLSGPCGGTFASVTVSTDPAGEATANLAVPGCYLGASATATATLGADGYYGSASASLRVSLLALTPLLRWALVYPGNVALFVVVMAVAVTLGWVLGRQRTIAPTAVPPPYPPPPPPTSDSAAAFAEAPVAPTTDSTTVGVPPPDSGAGKS